MNKLQVARPREMQPATLGKNVQPPIQPKSAATAASPMKGSQLRAQLRLQPPCNSPATSGDLKAAKVASVATANRIEARRQLVLAMLSAHPEWRYAVTTDNDAEPGSVVVHIGIRGIGSGEVVIAGGRYDGVELLRSLEGAENRGRTD